MTALSDMVRSAVSGIRSAVLAAELASAKLLLEADGVMLTSEMDALSMPAEVESTLAMTLREAATNIHRHAGARHARVSLCAEGEGVRLQVEDDGRGGELRAGNGISGMRERITALGGEVVFASITPQGTRVTAWVPMQVAA